MLFQDKIPNALGPFPQLLPHYRDINMSPADVCSDGAADRRTRFIHWQSSAPFCSKIATVHQPTRSTPKGTHDREEEWGQHRGLLRVEEVE